MSLSGMLRTQRFDDYRFYHQSTVNQTLHLFSAVIFLFCYALLFIDPALAGIVGWLAMLTRQTGHFFFEPNGYDAVNGVSNEYKEAIKVELEGLGLVGYVANSPNTVIGESYSAGRLYDKIDDTAEGKVLYNVEGGVLCYIS